MQGQYTDNKDGVVCRDIASLPQDRIFVIEVTLRYCNSKTCEESYKLLYSRKILYSSVQSLAFCTTLRSKQQKTWSSLTINRRTANGLERIPE